MTDSKDVKIDIPATSSTATTTTADSKSEPLTTAASAATTTPPNADDLCERCHKDATGRAKVEYHEHLARLCADCDSLAKEDKVLVKLKSVRQPPFISQSQRLKRIESFVVEKKFEHEPESE
jgi:hypothetical protein